MRTGRQQVTLWDLVDEAKKRNVFLFVCSVGLSYLMSWLQIIWMVCRKSDLTFISFRIHRLIVSPKSYCKSRSVMNTYEIIIYDFHTCSFASCIEMRRKA
ncbi:hypothetical protein Hdeb2414_s0013g00407231 [Helianthus debilis subsp. tardiflorus]